MISMRFFQPFISSIHFFSMFLMVLSCAESPREEIGLRREMEGKSSVSEPARNVNGIFDIPELQILPSPEFPVHISFKEEPVDLSVSPAGKQIALLLNKKGRCIINIWEAGATGFSNSFLLPDRFQATSLTWHPNSQELFVLGKHGEKYKILKIAKSNGWKPFFIYSSPLRLDRLVFCPRPFLITEYEKEIMKQYYVYRLFFGEETGNGNFRIISTTETGSRMYQVIGPAGYISVQEADELIPSKITSDGALPVAFHPAGHELVWEDKNIRFFTAHYNSNVWGKSENIDSNFSDKKVIFPLPNGLGFLFWQQGMKGIGVGITSRVKSSHEIQIPYYSFSKIPLPTPDGKGVVGWLKNSNGNYSLHYAPITVPLADVVNAWMFAETEKEIDLLKANHGLFRPHQFDQMYKLYETENYYCDGYSQTTPTRPYLVTTDVLWEVFAAAYHGIFVVKEREQAMPAFREFIFKAEKHFKNYPMSKWGGVFSVLSALLSDKKEHSEVRNMLDGVDKESDLLQRMYYYSDLKPRGHYNASPELQKYFIAFRYFTTVFENETNIMEELNTLPLDIKINAEKWVNVYAGLIAPSKAPLVWKRIQQPAPVYCQHPNSSLKAFPLSWGFDNEVFYSTVFHYDWPEAQQIKGAEGFRSLPSGIDLAVVLGNSFAESLLQEEFEKFPPLRKVIGQLKNNYQKNVMGNSTDNLYHEWINALEAQWADDVTLSKEGKTGLEKAKRLQTGLASWATLRHTSILVNERTSTECGEGGFEEIILRAPRGYVEKDPKTFLALANLFEVAKKQVEIDTSQLNNEKATLYHGIILRLEEAAGYSRDFARMAEKELKGEQLNDEENAKILYVARVAEHLFLVFNSLSNKDYGLANPDPIAKIADVAGSKKNGSYLMSGVGNTIEWDLIVPFYGRKQIVKGAVYSYYEFSSDKILNDEEWRRKVSSQPLLPWIEPYISEHHLSLPAVTKYW